MKAHNMISARAALCVLASVWLVASCSKSGPAAPGAAPSATAGASAAVSSDVQPDIKPGLREIHMRHVSGGGDAHEGVVRQCMDAATIASGKKTAADYARANCSKNVTTAVGAGRWASDLVCTASGHAMTTHSVTTLTGDGAYHTELTTAYDPPIAGQGASTTSTVDGTWIGPCPKA